MSDIAFSLLPGGFIISTNRGWEALHLFFLPGRLIKSWPMAYRWWVIVLHISFNRQSHPSTWIVCEWHHTVLFCQGNLIMSHPITLNSMWVTPYCFFFAKVISSCLISWPTVCKWHCLVSFSMQSHHVSSNDQQAVSNTAFYSKFFQAVSLCLVSWPTASEWHPFFLLPGSFIVSHPMTNRMWGFFFFQGPHSLITSHPTKTHPMANRL